MKTIDKVSDSEKAKKKYQREHYQKNKEIIKRRSKKWGQDNKDKRKIICKKNREKDKKKKCIVCGGPTKDKFCSFKCLGISRKGKGNTY